MKKETGGIKNRLKEIPEGAAAVILLVVMILSGPFWQKNAVVIGGERQSISLSKRLLVWRKTKTGTVSKKNVLCLFLTIADFWR